MVIPSESRIDEAVPPSGIPSRSKTNALLKDIISSAGPFRNRVAVPVSMVSPGNDGDYAISSNEGLYLYCADVGEWRVILMMGW